MSEIEHWPQIDLNSETEPELENSKSETDLSQ